ncbi:MAG: VCBS repeat-containing protein [Proteobacteria bacterium]|nr:VCBS repeat-containing protein [Pseudomonadota bacterium]
MRKQRYFLFLFCAAFLMSCSDGSNSDRADDKQACSVTETVCDNNQVMICEEGKAPTYQTCGEDEICRDGACEPKDTCSDDSLSCRDDQTIVKCTKGEMATYQTCGEDEICREGVCEPKDTCDEDSLVCQDDQTLIRCTKGKKAIVENCAADDSNGFCDSELKACQIPVTVNVGESCDRAHVCAEGVTCHETTHLCTLPTSGEGEACDDERLCMDGLYCENLESNTCMTYRSLGESCSMILECDPTLQCLDDVCRMPVNYNEACDDLHPCQGRCVKSVCNEVSELYKPCNELLVCPEESVCTDGQCVPIKGSCTTNANCTGDSYCCLDEAACDENVNHCIPYSTTNPNDTSCMFKTKQGIFEAAVQCYWVPEQDEYPDYNEVISSVSVGWYRNKQGVDKPLIAFASGATSIGTQNGYIRLIHPETCETLESIPMTNDASVTSHTMNGADLDGDGYMEFVVRNEMKTMVYHWDEAQQKHVPIVTAANIAKTDLNATFSFHDINNDGIIDIVAPGGGVMTVKGDILSEPKYSVSIITSPTVGDLNHDGIVEFVDANMVYQWKEGAWQLIATLNVTGNNIQSAYADFGTPGESFDLKKLDGVSEVVLVTSNSLSIWAIFDSTGALLPEPKNVYTFNYSGWCGYPPVIADVNNDGLPEIGLGTQASFRAYDPKCNEAEVASKRCAAIGYIWEKWNDDTSGQAGASAFDFDGDGGLELINGDEGYTRVYDGQTGEVLFSNYRSSITSLEYPVIADVDNDGSTEIVIVSDLYSYNRQLEPIDPIHRGIKCTEDTDCYSNHCVAGLCRCTEDAQCNWQTINGSLFEQHKCTTPLAGDENGGNVCRASRGAKMPGVMVLRDRLDRWVSSRTLWNQHAYNITNINDDGTIPKTDAWKQNFMQSGLNNYRQQVQGKTGAGVAPDITGRFTSGTDACYYNKNGMVQLNAQVCNRGTKSVGSKMPAVFYKESIETENILCVSYTADKVNVGDCMAVSCEFEAKTAQELVGKKIIMRVNDDGKGGKTTIECNEGNNTDEIVIEGCIIN